MKSLFNVGDTVTLIEKYPSGYAKNDYPYGLPIDFLRIWGGKQGMIIKVEKTTEWTSKLQIEDYIYTVDFKNSNDSSTAYWFSALSFQECNCITPGREDWDTIWTRRYPDVIFDRIQKNATVDLGISSSLSGCFIFKSTPEGEEFWYKVTDANMQQFKEYIAWLITEFPEDFVLTVSTIFTNNLTINQDENQLQRTKVNLGRDENQRGIVCVYSENRPRITISPLSYTAIGYRNGIEISRCED